MDNRSQLIEASIRDLTGYEDFRADAMITFDTMEIKSLVILTNALRLKLGFRSFWKDVKNKIKREALLWSKISKHWQLDVVRSLFPENKFPNGVRAVRSRNAKETENEVNSAQQVETTEEIQKNGASVENLINNTIITTWKQRNINSSSLVVSIHSSQIEMTAHSMQVQVECDGEKTDLQLESFRNVREVVKYNKLSSRYELSPRQHIKKSYNRYPRKMKKV